MTVSMDSTNTKSVGGHYYRGMKIRNLPSLRVPAARPGCIMSILSFRTRLIMIYSTCRQMKHMQMYTFA